MPCPQWRRTGQHALFRRLNPLAHAAQLCLERAFQQLRHPAEARDLRRVDAVQRA